MPADEANQVLEKKLSGKNKGTEWARPARQFYRLWTLSSVDCESPREQGSWPKSGMTWTVVGKQRKNLRHQVTSWATQRIKLPFYILRHDLCWKSAIQVIYAFDSRFKGKVCASNIAVRIVCVERTSQEMTPSQNVKAIKLLPSLHCTHKSLPDLTVYYSLFYKGVQMVTA